MRAAALIGALALLCVVVGAATAQPTKADPDSAGLAGTRLSDAQAAELEQHLAAQPDDLNARAQLLGYYSSRQRRNRSAAQSLAGHVLWIIEHQPAHELAGTRWMIVHRSADPQGYQQVKAAWLKQARAMPDNTAVLGNAAAALMEDDPAEAQALLEQAAKADPTNPQWPDRLAVCYHVAGLKADPAEQLDWARRALEQRRKAVELAGTPQERFEFMLELPQAALTAQDDAQAEQAAQDLLLAAEQHKDHWNYGNALHRAHVALGHVALRKSDVPGAVQHLQAAVQVPSSPPIRAFGPDFTLARALLEAGRRNDVIQYLQQCKPLWEMGEAQLDRWTADIREGRMPQLDLLTSE